MSTRVGFGPAGARRVLLGVFLTFVLVLALNTPARAEIPSYPFVGTLIGGLEPEPKPLRPKLEKPCGVAVTPEGDIFVSD